jgi:hypothetical protein
VATTARALIVLAFDACGLYAPGETIPAADASGALDRLNAMMRALKLAPLIAPTNVREVFDLVTDQGGPDNPYTIGPSGNFNTTRPASVAEITGWGLLLGGTDPALEIPRAMLTIDMFQAVQVKDLGGSLFTNAYYNPTYASDLGSIVLWPVPDNDDNQIVLYRNLPVATFTSLDASVDVPDGYEEALSYNLARRLLTPYGVTDPGTQGDVKELAQQSMAAVKRANTRITDLPTDPALTANHRGGYNINTGNY